MQDIYKIWLLIVLFNFNFVHFDFQTEGSVFGQGQAERQLKVRDHYVCSSTSSKKTEVFRPIIKKEVCVLFKRGAIFCLHVTVPRN
jgi:hypothetical protein